jgi:hypothetical protein
MEREARNPGFVPVATPVPHYAAAFAALRRPLHAGYTQKQASPPRIHLKQLINRITN